MKKLENAKRLLSTTLLTLIVSGGLSLDAYSMEGEKKTASERLKELKMKMGVSDRGIENSYNAANTNPTVTISTDGGEKLSKVRAMAKAIEKPNGDETKSSTVSKHKPHTSLEEVANAKIVSTKKSKPISILSTSVDSPVKLHRASLENTTIVSDSKLRRGLDHSSPISGIDSITKSPISKVGKLKKEGEATSKDIYSSLAEFNSSPKSPLTKVQKLRRQREFMNESVDDLLEDSDPLPEPTLSKAEEIRQKREAMNKSVNDLLEDFDSMAKPKLSKVEEIRQKREAMSKSVGDLLVDSDSVSKPTTRSVEDIQKAAALVTEDVDKFLNEWDEEDDDYKVPSYSAADAMRENIARANQREKERKEKEEEVKSFKLRPKKKFDADQFKQQKLEEESRLKIAVSADSSQLSEIDKKKVTLESKLAELRKVASVIRPELSPVKEEKSLKTFGDRDSSGETESEESDSDGEDTFPMNLRDTLTKKLNPYLSKPTVVKKSASVRKREEIKPSITSVQNKLNLEGRLAGLKAKAIERMSQKSEEKDKGENLSSESVKSKADSFGDLFAKVQKTEADNTGELNLNVVKPSVDQESKVKEVVLDVAKPSMDFAALREAATKRSEARIVLANNDKDKETTTSNPLRDSARPVMGLKLQDLRAAAEARKNKGVDVETLIKGNNRNEEKKGSEVVVEPLSMVEQIALNAKKKIEARSSTTTISPGEKVNKEGPKQHSFLHVLKRTSSIDAEIVPVETIVNNSAKDVISVSDEELALRNIIESLESTITKTSSPKGDLAVLETSTTTPKSSPDRIVTLSDHRKSFIGIPVFKMVDDLEIVGGEVKTSGIPVLDKEGAAKKIQRAFRSHNKAQAEAQREVLKTAAATDIQRVFRGYKARAEAQRNNEEYLGLGDIERRFDVVDQEEQVIIPVNVPVHAAQEEVVDAAVLDVIRVEVQPNIEEPVQIVEEINLPVELNVVQHEVAQEQEDEGDYLGLVDMEERFEPELVEPRPLMVQARNLELSNQAHFVLTDSYFQGNSQPVSELYSSLSRNENSSIEFENKEIVQTLINFDKNRGITQNSEAEYILNDLKQSRTPEEMRDVIKQVINKSETKSSDLMEFKRITQNIESLVDGRSIIAGAAADDLKAANYSFWGKGFFGKDTQEKEGLYNGYESKYYGGTIGLDTFINEKFNLGIAASTALNKIDRKDGTNTSDEHKIIIGSIYSSINFANNFILDGSISLGQSNTDGDKDNIKSDLLSARMLAGYKIDVNGLSIIPTVGVKLIDISTTETSKRKRLPKDDFCSIEGVLGLKISKEIAYNGYIFVPEIYASLSHDFSDGDKKNKLMQGVPSIFEMTKPFDKSITKNIGVSLTFKSSRFEVGGKFDSVFMDKYQGFSGSFKLKINL